MNLNLKEFITSLLNKISRTSNKNNGIVYYQRPYPRIWEGSVWGNNHDYSKLSLNEEAKATFLYIITGLKKHYRQVEFREFKDQFIIDVCFGTTGFSMCCVMYDKSFDGQLNISVHSCTSSSSHSPSSSHSNDYGKINARFGAYVPLADPKCLERVISTIDEFLTRTIWDDTCK